MIWTTAATASGSLRTLLEAAERKESAGAEKKVQAGAQQPAGAPCYRCMFSGWCSQQQPAPCLSPTCQWLQQVLHGALCESQTSR